MISIHAPREGGDNLLTSDDGTINTFQSTPPARGATHCFRRFLHEHSISIHAPREGGDAGDPVVYIMTGISIHAPREGGDRRGLDLPGLL